jgi:hypothetical protein
VRDDYSDISDDGRGPLIVERRPNGVAIRGPRTIALCLSEVERLAAFAVTPRNGL